MYWLIAQVVRARSACRPYIIIVPSDYTSLSEGIKIRRNSQSSFPLSLRLKRERKIDSASRNRIPFYYNLQLWKYHEARRIGTRACERFDLEIELLFDIKFVFVNLMTIKIETSRF